MHFAALPPLLFDLQNDPQETRNLASDPAHRETLLTCTQELLSHRLRHAERTLAASFITGEGVVTRYEPRY